MQDTSRVPVPLTPLLGREHEVAALRELVRRTDVRLVTCVGPAGVGKTRLALHLARDVEPHFADGIAVVSLASIRDPHLVLPTIAQSLQRPPTAEALIDYLADKHSLLVLDNFEQVIAAAPLLIDLMATCPDLKVLVTSREALRVRGEYEFPVPPLAPPEAISLFAQRAHAIQPSIVLDDTLAPTIEAICRRLDCLPLAIELAAARVKVFPPAFLLTRLAHRLQVLSSGPRDLPARQQTLRSALAWSYELLSPGDQRVFRRLGVFASGCTLEAAEQVAPVDASSSAASLIDKNLLRQIVQVDGEPRLLMLETMREYALEQLALSGESDAMERTHAGYYCSLAEYAEAHLLGSDVRAWLDRLEREHDNLRQALGWALQQRDADLAQRLSGALWRFWFLRGHLSEGRGWLEAALALQGASISIITAKALSGAGYLATAQSDYARAEILCADALRIAEELGDERSRALALFGLANTCNWGRDYGQARSLFEASLAIYRTLNDHWGIASTLAYLGNVLYFHAEYATARRHFDEALTLFRTMGQEWGIAFTLYGRGLVAVNQRDPKAAQQYLEESQNRLRQLGDRRGLIRAVTGLAMVACEQDRMIEARALLLEAMRLTREVGDQWSMTATLDVMAGLCARRKEAQLAARLCGAAEALRDSLGVPLAPALRDQREPTLLLIRSQLSRAALERAWSEGRSLAPEAACSLFETTKLGIVVKGTSLDALTAREIEVVRLVAEGLTDAAIAEHLVISIRTVHAHLRSIYSKLDVTTRTGAVRRALEHGLLPDSKSVSMG
jgi:predicted ATPase/DNA-binding CsgD family transcriptional regulator